LAANLAVHQPEKIRAGETEALLRKLAPDCIVIIAYGQIIPRGCSPFQNWAGLICTLPWQSERMAVTPVVMVNTRTRSDAPCASDCAGCVQINPAQFWNGEQPRGDNLSVSDDDNTIGSQFPQQRLCFPCPNLFRLMNGKIGRQRCFLYRRKETSWPRPRGRSGCVIAARISKSDCARRCLSVGTANEGVPQKNNSHHQFTAAAKRPTPALTTRPVS